MKNFLLFLIVTLFCIHSQAQELKNVIKLLPMNLPLTSLAMEYERMIDPKNSVEFGIGIPLKSSFVNKFGMTWSESEHISSNHLGIFSMRGAYRHYTGKSMLPKGFYVAPFLKFQNVSAAADNVRFVTDTEIPYSYSEDYDVKINTISIGCQLGYQFLISKTISLDLFFFGLEGGLGKVNAHITTNNAEETANIQQDIQDTVDDFPSMWKNNIDVSSQGYVVSIVGKKLFYPWYRGGFSLGVAF